MLRVCVCVIQLLSTAVTPGLTWLYIPAVSYKTSSHLSPAGLLLTVGFLHNYLWKFATWKHFFLYFSSLIMDESYGWQLWSTEEQPLINGTRYSLMKWIHFSFWSFIMYFICNKSGKYLSEKVCLLLKLFRSVKLGHESWGFWSWMNHLWGQNRGMNVSIKELQTFRWVGNSKFGLLMKRWKLYQSEINLMLEA